MSSQAQRSQQTQSSFTSTQTASQTSLPTLVLRGVSTEQQRHIQWAEDVVDNEGMGKKSSKGLQHISPPHPLLTHLAVCCIYHRPREAGESSDDEPSSSDSSDDNSSDDDGKARSANQPASKNKRRKRPHNHTHNNGDACPGDESDGGNGEGSSNGGSHRRRPSPNAYERVPKYNDSKLKQTPVQPGASNAR
jgi:protein phosphatase 1 regulatory subunit 11